MADAAELVKAIKKTSVEAVGAAKPVEVRFGTVTGVSPLKIQVEQRLTLGRGQLVLTGNVSERRVEMTVDHCTENDTSSHTHILKDSEGTAEETELTHCHKIEGRKSFIVHSGLAMGDKVVLLRQQGGQKYIVWDRVL